MYKVVYYKDSRGESEVKRYIDYLSTFNSKDARIQLKKIRAYIELLSQYGKALGEPFIKPVNLKYDLWELRPNKNRILFFTITDEEFILLTHFIKKTNKTPKGEIERAIQIIKNMKGGIDYE